MEFPITMAILSMDRNTHSVTGWSNGSVSDALVVVVVFGALIILQYGTVYGIVYTFLSSVSET